jgi:hypothetical protein
MLKPHIRSRFVRVTSLSKVAFGIIWGLLRSMVERRFGLLLPLIFLLLFLALLLVILGSAGPLAPFVYPLF